MAEVWFLFLSVAYSKTNAGALPQPPGFTALVSRERLAAASVTIPHLDLIRNWQSQRQFISTPRQNSLALRQNSPALRQNSSALRQVGPALRQNNSAPRQNGPAPRQNRPALRQHSPAIYRRFTVAPTIGCWFAAVNTCFVSHFSLASESTSRAREVTF